MKPELPSETTLDNSRVQIKINAYIANFDTDSNLFIYIFEEECGLFGSQSNRYTGARGKGAFDDDEGVYCSPRMYAKRGSLNEHINNKYDTNLIFEKIKNYSSTKNRLW